MSKKDDLSKIRASGAVVDWAMRFWLPNLRESRFSDTSNIAIRNVTAKISGDDGFAWLSTGIDSESILLQPVLDKLQPGTRYLLELSVPEGDPYRSSGPAGPHMGRVDPDELPPLRRYDYWDYQVRPAQLDFEVEVAVGSKGEATGAKRIAQIFEHPYVRSRPPVARGSLVFDNRLKVSHLEVDWRPDWLRRARAYDQAGDLNVAISPRSDEYSYVGGSPTHIVLHNVGGEDLDCPLPIGSPINELTAAWIKSKNPWARDWKGIHYLIDYDGHVLKLATNSSAVGHSGGSEWRGGGTTMNRLAIGIEHVHHLLDTHFPDEQRAASVHLVRQLINHFGIDARNVVGHGEVRTIRRGTSSNDTKEQNTVREYTEKHWHLPYDKSWGPALHPNDRLESCPGPQFFWDAMADEGLIPNVRTLPTPSAWLSSASSKYFKGAGKSLRRGDRAYGNDKIELGGSSDIPNDVDAKQVLEEVYRAIRGSGYSVPSGAHNHNDQSFEWPLELATRAFQLKHTNLRSKDDDYGRIDKVTAEAAFIISAHMQQGEEEG